MAKRYNKIEYTKILGPSLSEYFDVLKKGAFYSIAGLVPDIYNGRLTLAEEFAEFEINNARSAQGFPVSAVHLGDGFSAIYHLIYNITNTRVEYWRQEPYSAPAYLANLGSTSTAPLMTISYKSLLLFFYYDTTIKLTWSDDEGATKTITNWAYDTPRSYFITDENILYVRTLFKLLKSSDGLNWTVVYDAQAVGNFVQDADELDGEIYLIITDEFKNYNSFCRLEDNVPKQLRLFGGGSTPSKLRAFDNRIIITELVNGLLNFYEWDKGALTRVARYNFTLDESSNGVDLPLADDDYLYIVINGETIIRLNVNNAIYEINTYSPDQTDDYATSMLKWLGNICIGFSNTGVNSSFNFLMHRADGSEIRQASGVFVTPIYDKKHIPAYLITKHKPLGDDASVTIKAKLDHESTFATTVLTDTTNDSIGECVELKDLITEANFVQFEITLADSSGAGDVKDFQLLYLNILNGLQNAT